MKKKEKAFKFSRELAEVDIISEVHDVAMHDDNNSI